MLTKHDDVLEVATEETINEILDRYLEINSHAASYTWKRMGRVLNMDRNLSQNDKYWAILEGLSDHMGYTKEELHELLKYKFLKYAKEIAGQPVVVVPSTSDLDTGEFAEYIENVLRFANEYGCSFQSGEMA